jgi:hypothetical protein
LRIEAEQVSRKGNQVRAALILERAAAVATGAEANTLHAAARSEIESLVTRLEAALHLDASHREVWVDCLYALAPVAAAGRIWNIEGRLLYDLQKVCLDVERPLYAADLVEWVFSLFQRPIKRALPDQSLVLMVKHLRTASNRLPGARLASATRQHLGELLRGALHHAEERMRAMFKPKLAATLDKVGLEPQSVAERLSRDQLIEELLDTIGTRGTISLGDLRDAIARSRQKLADLGGAGEFFTADALLGANRELAVQLDGVYRRGESYLRWLQSLGSLFFGTMIGRWLTLYVILPLLGSLLILKGTDEILHLWHQYLGGPGVVRSAEEIAEWQSIHPDKPLSPTRGYEVFNRYTFLGFAVFLLPMFHVPRFRGAIFQVFHYAWRAVRGVVYDAPRAFFDLSIVRGFLQSKPYWLFWQFVGKPMLWVLPVLALLYLWGVPKSWILGISIGWFFLVSLLGNTRAGMLVEETTTDSLVRTWLLVRDDLVPGVISWFSWVSRFVVDRMERLMYTVDEALRFRQGQSRIAFVLKLVLGVFWFGFTYLFRLLFNVFLEPQVNPIKHFPVVTVAHKLTLPLIYPFSQMLAAQTGMSLELALTVGASLQFLTPGMWGFLAWELKENWRLYRANAPKTILPAVIGGHGEQMIQFLRPGFHSGTLPKLFAKLRRAKGRRERKQEEGLHHVEVELKHFLERELLAVLHASKAWDAQMRVAVGHLDLATNQIGVELATSFAVSRSQRATERETASDVRPEPISHQREASAWLEFSNRDGRLYAHLADLGWVAQLDDSSRNVLSDALVGLYKRAGVDVVEGERGLIETMDDKPVLWTNWVERWQRDEQGERDSTPLLPGVRMLPEASARV